MRPVSEHISQGTQNDKWTRLVVFFLWSGLFIGKASAFIGMAVGVLLLFSPSVLWSRWYLALTDRRHILGSLAWPLLISMLYGLAQVIYGVSVDNPLVTALQILIFNLCPLYLFLGIWVGTLRPDVTRKYIRFVAWFTVFYVPLYLLIFNKIHLSLSGILPGSNLELLGAPGSGSSTLLGLFTYEPNLAPFWLPIFVLSLLTIAGQMRADWLGLGLALLIWGIATKRLGRVFAIAGFILALLLIGFVADIKAPPIPGRGGGEISARETIARIAGAVSPELSEEAGASHSDASSFAGTVYWRTMWWAGIRQAVYESYRTTVFGLGYGYPIKNLGGAQQKSGDTRSPHSIFYFVLGYSGWTGIVIFFWLQVSIFHLLWKSFKVTGQIYGLTFYAAEFLGAFFGNSLETPQAGIYIYLLVGICIGAMFSKQEMHVDADDSGSAEEYGPWSESSELAPRVL